MSTSRPQRQSWKRPSSTSAKPGGSRRGARWVLSLLALGLVAVLVWVVYSQFRRAERTHFVAVIAGDHAKLTVPSLPFAHHDFRDLREGTHRFLAYHDLSKVLESNNTGSLASELRALSLGDNDTLILYVSAHGRPVPADANRAELLCRDFDLRDLSRRHWAIEDLLADLQQSGAERTLLILDAGHLPADSRLGLFVNEFPRIVRKTLQRSDARDLWVLMSCADLEASAVEGPHSVFGSAVAEGLLGAADANQDLHVDLPELFQYTYARCDAATAGRQSVQLITSGPDQAETFAEIPPISLMLVEEPVDEDATAPDQAAPDTDALSASHNDAAQTRYVLQPQTAADPANPVASTSEAGTAPSETATETNASPSTAAPTTDSAPVPADSAATTVSDSTAPSSEATPSTETQLTEVANMRSLLDQAWLLRDELQTADLNLAWLPEEYATPLWRELNQLLLDSERWLLSGSNQSLRLQLEKHVEGLQLLKRETEQQDTSAPGATGDLVTDRLRRARVAFASSEPYRAFASAERELANVATDIRRLRRLEIKLPDYVRWYTLHSLMTPDNDQTETAVADRIARLLTSTENLQRLLRQHEGQPATRLLASEVNDQVNLLAETDQQLQSRIDELISQAATRPDVPAFRQRIAVYLDTSLPSASQRQTLRTLLEQSPQAQSESTSRSFPMRRPISNVQWQRVLKRWRMEEALVRLADPSATLPTLPTRLEDTDSCWEQLRMGGENLRDRYVQRVGDGTQDPGLSLADARPLLDGRDAPFLTSERESFPSLGLQPPVVPITLQVSWQPVDELPLKTEWQDATLNLAATTPERLATTVSFDFDESQLEIRTDNGRAIRSGAAPPFDLVQSRTLALQIRAKQAVDRPGESTLRSINVSVAAGNLRGAAELRCLLPRPDDVELVITRLGSDAPELSSTSLDQLVVLRTFANRTTHFRWQLRNLSGIDKQVSVKLLPLPTLRNATWAPGRILNAEQQPHPAILRAMFEPDGKRILPGLSPLHATQAPISIPGDGTLVDLVFQNGPPADPATATPAAPSADTPPPSAPDISTGLLCVIEEGDRRWLKWIELQTIPPRDYLKVDVSYDMQRLRVQLAPRGAVRLPLGLNELPVSVTWDVGRLIEEQLRVGDRVETGSIAAPAEQIQLYADVGSSRDRVASVRLDVDRYPRAFIFEVPLDRRSELDDPRRDLPELVVQSLSSSAFPRVYVTSESERRQFEATRLPDDKREVQVLKSGQPAAFPRPDLGDTMQIKLRADAAVSAFGRADTDDSLSVALYDRLGSVTFEQTRYADRQANYLLEQAEAGRISITSRLSDHEFLIAPERMEGDYQLRATLRVGGEELRYPPIPVVFDGQPPQILRPLAVSPTRAEQGKAIDVSFEASDPSGIARVEVGFVKTLNDPLADDTKVVLEYPSGPLLRTALPAAEVGDFWVKAKIVDRVGRVTETKLDTSFVPIRVQVTAPVEKTETAEDQPVVGNVVGFTQIRDRKIDRISVKLTGDKELPAVQTKDGGRFEFKNVPAGKYKLEAAGYWNGDRVGELPIELKQPSDYRTFIIPLQPKPAE